MKYRDRHLYWSVLIFCALDVLSYRIFGKGYSSLSCRFLCFCLLKQTILSMNNKYGCVNISKLEWAGMYLALFFLSTVYGYGRSKKKLNKQRHFQMSDSGPFFCPHYIGVFSQLNCFYWCMKFIDESCLVGSEAKCIHICCIVLDCGVGWGVSIKLMRNILQPLLHSTLYLICLDID